MGGLRYNRNRVVSNPYGGYHKPSSYDTGIAEAKKLPPCLSKLEIRSDTITLPTKQGEARCH